ncbi:hypothetical protein [Stenotrophomonas maltophilia]|uniref:outer membrane lipoprotein n=1 Tax=Stenotrophomonas maltophilia TaxID=40324 RepID=UPI0012FDB19E|nr:hypothetical protein [Stenotrophomonas maltophilia]
MKLHLSIALTALMLASAPAMASDTSARSYGRQEALSAQNVQLGQVLTTRIVQIESTKNLNAGSAIGAAVGYGLASKVKSSSGRNAARVAAGTIGGVAGSSVQNRLSKRQGIEIIVQVENRQGRQELISIVQDNDQLISAGDLVLITGRGSKMRVSPLNQ